MMGTRSIKSLINQAMYGIRFLTYVFGTTTK